MCNLEVKHERDEDVKLNFLLKIKTRLKITHFSLQNEEYLIKIHVDATKIFFSHNDQLIRIECRKFR